MRVAAYQQVSMRDMEQTSSLELLKQSCEERINRCRRYKCVGCYFDEMGGRKAFARLMEAAENGEIDRIETKSAFDFIGSIDELVSTASRLNSLDNPVRVHFDVEGVTTGTAEWERCVGFLMSFLHSEKRRDAADAERRERVMCGT